MTVPVRQGISASHRARVLRALGVTPWARRVTAVPAGAAETAVFNDVSEPAAMAHGACVVVLPHGSPVRELDLLGRALNACGPMLARSARAHVSEGELADVPSAPAYLVFGAAQAHALGRRLPIEVMQHAQIVLADELTEVLRDAGAKRRLWSALRSLRKTLAAVDA